MRKINLSKFAAIIFIVSVATAVFSPAQTITTVYSFCSQPSCNDGLSPLGRLVQGTDGLLYGATYGGGASGYGTIYKTTPSGSLIVLHDLSGLEDGAYPYAGLTRGSDGNFYGVTTAGGDTPSACGTVYKIDSSGNFIWLHRFMGYPGDGSTPWGPLVQASDGNFYGTTTAGGNVSCGGGGCGSVFRMTPSGTVTILYSFTAGSDGYDPSAGLIQGSDGYLYGESNGASANYGTIFKISLNGAFTLLHAFDYTDGYEPYGGLIQASDGNFYGTTAAGGTGNQKGTVFKMTSSGTLTTLYSFCPRSGCVDGADPIAGLLQGSDGNFYGTTYYGGTTYNGTIFAITPSGALTTLYSFIQQGNDGGKPYAALIQASDGNFYGTTQYGGANGSGTVFRFAPLPVLTVAVTGSGSVTSSDGFINCPGTCSHTYSNGALVTLNATPGTNWIFGGWSGGCLGTSSCNLTMTQSIWVDVIFSQALQFVSVTPCRLVDSRGTHSPIMGGTAQSYPVPQLGNCNIPSTASAYSLNVTVVPHEALGYLSIWPTGENQPVVSTMNSLDGRTKANAAIVPAGTSGAVSVFASNTTDLVLDIDGYFTTAGSETLEFYPLTPCRVIDTRGGNSDLGGPYLAGETERDFAVLQSSCIPTKAHPQAYSFNVTVVPHIAGAALGYLSIWPQGESQPTVSTLNNLTATDVANAAIVPAGNNGAIAVFPSNATDLVVDINGYFASPEQGGGLQLYSAVPCRVIDTRGVGAGNPIAGEYTVNVAGSVCSPPATAQAYVFNSTVVPTGALGFLSLWPDGLGQPVVSTLNALDGSITSNMAIVPTQNGSVDCFASNSTQMILDISSYFAP